MCGLKIITTEEKKKNHGVRQQLSILAIIDYQINVKLSFRFSLKHWNQKNYLHSENFEMHGHKYCLV